MVTPKKWPNEGTLGTMNISKVFKEIGLGMGTENEVGKGREAGEFGIVEAQ